ncbi:HAMP domain-containing sensor histidine kinase [Microbacterium sp. AK031]|uniref:sensor histidine kinase n=1 Tax=Microbacterium sp. AK031 TaxID=2723076 RepID=UPI0021682E5E|nr:HAMP domain-containing sensor histidine kinase [Microbacterium sp. AK031]MCS3844682.1 two-component system sensor histidine kinase VanS [Microbacterium sp. AK031]
MARRRGLSARVKLTLSYAGFLLIAGALLLAVVALFLLRYVPDGQIRSMGPFVPNRSDLVRAFVPPTIAALVFLLALGLIGGWFLAGRMLAPLTRLNEAARLASEGSLSHRVDMPGAKDEFRDLADVFDTMLARLEAHVEEQRRFASNASHELRTPLAISQTMLEVARDDPDRDVDVLIDRLQNVNTRAIALTEALLLLARADRGTFERERVELSLLAEEAVESLHPLADRCGVTLDIRGTTAFANGSPTLLQQLIVNLIHNAIVHNIAAGGSVEVRTEMADHGAVMIVENTGEVIPAHLLATLREPFQRGAGRFRSKDAAHAGAGLGLAIAEGITRAHGGTLEQEPRGGGGLIVTVRLPVE